MSEEQVIQRSKELRTRASLASDLSQFKLPAEAVMIVHGSLSSLGWVCGGPVALIQALLDWLGPAGTLVMPAHSGDLTDPATWENPAVPQEWWEPIRQHMPGYDPALTPTRGLGRTPELFRTWPGARRSDHPTFSFAAVGPHAKQITAGHQLDFGMGEHSPLARLYDLNSWVLLLGVGYDSNTSFHLAEYRAAGATIIEEGTPVMRQGERRWLVSKEIELHEEWFDQLGQDFEREGEVTIHGVGSANARLFRQRDCVDFAVPRIEARRQQSTAA